LILHAPHRKRCLQQLFVAAGSSLPNCDLATTWCYTDRHTRPTIILLLRVFVAAQTCLPSFCLTTIGEIHIQTHRHMRPTIVLLLRVFVAAETFLPSRCQATIRGIHIQTRRLMGGIYEVRRLDGLRFHDIHAKFNKDWFRYSKVHRGDTQTYR
jgi:hypothetical protein